MKKFFLSAVAAFVGLSVSAQLELTEIVNPNACTIERPAESLKLPPLAGCSRPTELKMIENVAEPVKAPARVLAEDEWDDWQPYCEGTVSGLSRLTILYPEYDFPTHVAMLRREAKEDPSMVQLKFDGLFPFDFVMNYDEAASKLSWGRTDTGRVYPDEYSEGNAYLLAGSVEFSSKRDTYFNFRLGISTQYMYVFTMDFVPDNKPDSSYKFEAVRESVNATSGIFRFTDLGSGVHRIRYVILPGLDPIVKQENGYYTNGFFYLMKNNSTLIEYKDVYVAADRKVDIPVQFEETGAYTINFLLYDNDGDYLKYNSGLLYSNLKEPEKWTDAGMAKLTFRVLDDYVVSQLAWFESNTDFTVLEKDYGEFYGKPSSWDVAIQQSVDNPGTYRLVNPFKGACPYAEEMKFSIKYTVNSNPDLGEITQSYSWVFDRSTDNDYYYVFHTENTDCVWAVCSEAGFGLNRVETSSTQGVIDRGSYNFYWDLDLGADRYHVLSTDPTYMPSQIALYGKQVRNDHGTMIVNLPGYNDNCKAKAEVNNHTARFAEIPESVAKVRYAFATSKKAVESALAGTADAEITVFEMAAPDFNTDIFELPGSWTNGEYVYMGVESYDNAGVLQNFEIFQSFYFPYELEFYGNVTVVDPLFSNVFGEFNVSEVDVNAYVSSENPNHLYLMDVFRAPNHVLPDYLITYPENIAASIMDIELCDEGAVMHPANTWLDSSVIGWSGGYFYEGNVAGIRLSTGLSSENIGSADFGTYDRTFNGITFPAGNMYMQTETQLGTLSVFGRSSEDYVIKLPGYVDGTFEVELENDMPVVTAYGEDIEKVLYTFVEAATESDALAEFEKIDGGDESGLKTCEGLGALDVSDLTPMKPYVLIYKAYCNNGDQQTCLGLSFFFEGSYTNIGMGTILPPLWAFINGTIEEISVPVYKYEGQPNKFFVKDLMSAYFGVNITRPATESSYMCFDCTDPNNVITPDHHLGYQGYYLVQAAYGKLEGDIITFPAGSHYILSGRQYVAANADSEFYLQLPEGTGVEGVAVEADGVDAEPIYYDVLGRRVLNPAPGTIVIERRGNTTVKRVVR